MKEDNKNLAWAQGSMAFFHFLQDRPAERFSRFEAYCYMLDKACAKYKPENIPSKWVPAIGEGQFFITKSELANDWHWHRATVRWFLDKLSEFGHLSIEEHLKGILCTMHHIIIPVNPSVAVAYNFDSMAKYAMYSYARGTHNAAQTAIVCGQIERSANFMLDGNLLSPYAQKQLEDVRKTILHYAIEATIAHYPGKLAAADEVRYNSMLVEKRLYEFFTEHLGGKWDVILVLMSNQTELAFSGIVQSLFAGRTERIKIWKSLSAEAETLLNPPADTTEQDSASPSDTDDGPDDYSSVAASKINVAPSSAAENAEGSNNTDV